MDPKDITKGAVGEPGEPGVPGITGIDYVAEITKLKSSTVSIDKYNKSVEENKQLMKALVENQQIKDPKPKATRQELATKLRDMASNGATNLNVVNTLLELREKVIEEDGYASYIPDDTLRTDPTFDQRVAGQLQDIVDSCEGDSKLFAGYYDRGVKESVGPQQWNLIKQ